MGGISRQLYTVLHRVGDMSRTRVWVSEKVGDMLSVCKNLWGTRMAWSIYNNLGRCRGLHSFWGLHHSWTYPKTAIGMVIAFGAPLFLQVTNSCHSTAALDRCRNAGSCSIWWPLAYEPVIASDCQIASRQNATRRVLGGLWSRWRVARFQGLATGLLESPAVVVLEHLGRTAAWKKRHLPGRQVEWSTETTTHIET